MVVRWKGSVSAFAAFPEFLTEDGQGVCASTAADTYCPKGVCPPVTVVGSVLIRQRVARHAPGFIGFDATKGLGPVRVFLLEVLVVFG